jgi:hypothetical protein
MRNQVGDTRRRIHIDWTADGVTNIFQLPADTFPILDQVGTYTVKVATVAKTETTDYTLDKEAGTLVLGATPTVGQAITLDASAVYLTDQSWLDITNDTIRSLGDDFFKESTDDTLTATANMLSLALSTGFIAVYGFMTRTSSSEDYFGVEELTNWRYSRDENKIYIGNRDAFTLTGQVLRIKGLKTYTIGTAVTDTLDLQDKYLTILDAGCTARFWRHRYKNVIELVSKMSTESTRTPLQELMMLADRAERLFETEKLRLKPAKPARLIPIRKDGGGNP